MGGSSGERTNCLGSEGTETAAWNPVNVPPEVALPPMTDFPETPPAGDDGSLWGDATLARRVPREPTPMRVLGRYDVGEKRGEGGMGAVYRATDAALRRDVAVKVLAEDRRDDPESLARFLRERRACARMDHPHVVRVLDAGEEGSTPYLVMEWLDGLTLQEISTRLGPLPVADAARAAIQALEGMRHAFERGLVHRDIKPSNLMVTPRGGVKVLDWGLSRFLESNEEFESRFVTRPIVAFGTPQFMAPERTLRPDLCDVRSDLFSLGATLYNLLVGRPPRGLQGSGAAEPSRPAIARTPPSARDARPEIPRGLDRAIGRMMSPAIDHRPSTADEAIELLRPFARGANLDRLLATAQARSAEPEDPPSEPRSGTPASRPSGRAKYRQAAMLALPWAAAAVAIAVAVAPRVLPERWRTPAARRSIASATTSGASPVPAVTPPPNPAPAASLVVRLPGKSRRTFRPGEPIRLEVTPPRAGSLLAYHVPVIDGRPGAARPIREGGDGIARNVQAGRAAQVGSGMSAGPRGRGIILLALAPESISAKDAEATAASAVSTLRDGDAGALEALKGPAWPDGWTCRLVRYDVLGEPVE